MVLDASVALAWIFERSNKKEATCADRVLQKMEMMETIVPVLWHIEVSNALLVGERRRVITEAQTIDYLARLSDLPLITETAVSPTVRHQILSLGREYGLTAYDATYMELALRTQSTLATFDAKLAGALQKAGGVVF